MYENPVQMKLILPSIGVLLAMRDKNQYWTISSLYSLPEAHFSKVKNVSAQFAPDLQSNILNFSKSDPPKYTTLEKVGAPEEYKMQSEISISEDHSIPEEGERNCTKGKGIFNAIGGGQGNMGDIDTMHAQSATYSVPYSVPKHSCPHKQQMKGSFAPQGQHKTVDIYNSNPVTQSQPLNANDWGLLQNDLPHLQILIDNCNTDPSFCFEALKAILRASQSKNLNSGFWETSFLKVLNLLFRAIISVDNKPLQEFGFTVLKDIINNQFNRMLPFIDTVIQNLISCYQFARQV